jgi:hypothetical protein
VTAPIPYHQAIKTHLAFEYIGKQIFVAMHACAIPTGKGGHYCLNTGAERTEITGAVDVMHELFIALGWAAIHTVQSSAIANKMFGGGDHMFIR